MFSPLSGPSGSRAGTTTRRAPRRGRWLALVCAVALAAPLLAPAPASAGLLDNLFGGGGGGGGGGSTGGGGGGTSTPPPGPPAGGHSAEGEALTPGTVVTNTSAHGGKFLRTVGAAGALGTPAGVKEITVRAKAPQPVRLRITVDGEIVGTHTLRSGWATYTALGRVAGPSSTVGIATEPIPGTPEGRTADLDWIHAGAHAPVLTTLGNQIVSPSGQPLRLQGFTMPGYQAALRNNGRLDLPPSFSAEQYAWGATLVRIPMNQEHWLANCASRKDGVEMSYREAIAEEVDNLTSRGIVVSLTLTRTERGKATGCSPASDPAFKEMPDNRSVPFWRQVAKRFAPNPLVVFDLFNEPHSIQYGVWRNGGTITYGSGGLFSDAPSYKAVGLQTLVNTVRATGADNLLLVSGNRWAADPRAHLQAPIDGSGVVAALHTYCHGCNPPRLDDTLAVTVTDEVLARVPLLVTETGWRNSNDSRYNRLFLDWADERGLGWTIYGWGHPDADYTVLDGWVPATHPVGGGLTTMAPSMSGAPVWNALAPVRASRGLDATPIPES